MIRRGSSSPTRVAWAVGALIAIAAGALAWALAGAGSDETGREAGSGSGSVPPSPDGSAAGSFVESGGRRRAEVWAVGDGAEDRPAARKVGRLIERSRPDRVLYLGDVYPTGTAEEFAENYAPIFGPVAEITAPTLGNHEAPNAEEGYEPYWEGVHGVPPPSYYAFRTAGWQLLSLNSEIDFYSDSEQVAWLERKVAGGGNCRLAFWHRPRYNAGSRHGDDKRLEALWEVLAGRARLIVNAHDHNMQRIKRRRGITQLVSGAGGKSLYPIDSDYAGLAFGNDRRFGALRLRLRRGRAAYAFVSAGGKKLDSGVVRCRAG